MDNSHKDIDNTKAIFKIADRVGVTLYYLTHRGNFAAAGQQFGMGKASAVQYLWQVVHVINKSCLALDGTQCDGWYSRKRYPAINAQIVVDSRHYIRSSDMHPGSVPDQAVFNYSDFGKTIHKKIPPGKYIISDVGYTLYKHVLIPYEIWDKMPHVAAD
ncbi:putative nuclease harbi1, partial [Nowakowskiella sp. JEL0078]